MNFFVHEFSTWTYCSLISKRNLHWKYMFEKGKSKIFLSRCKVSLTPYHFSSFSRFLFWSGLMMNRWWTDELMMINWWSTDDLLVIKLWSNNDQMMISWWHFLMSLCINLSSDCQSDNFDRRRSAYGSSKSFCPKFSKNTWKRSWSLKLWHLFSSKVRWCRFVSLKPNLIA